MVQVQLYSVGHGKKNYSCEESNSISPTQQCLSWRQNMLYATMEVYLRPFIICIVIYIKSLDSVFEESKWYKPNLECMT